MPKKLLKKRKNNNNNRPLTLYIMSAANYNSKRAAIPDQFDTTLLFVTQGYSYFAGATFGLTRYTPNGAYDVDPSLGSTSTSGFAELAALYYYYRVVAYQVEYDLANNEAFPLAWSVVHVNSDPGTSTLANYTTGSGNAFGRSGIMCAGSGVGIAHYKSRVIKLSELVGGVDVETGDNWRGGSAANPTDLVYTGFAVSSPASRSLTSNNGISWNVRIKMWVRFYDRKNLTS